MNYLNWYRFLSLTLDVHDLCAGNCVCVLNKWCYLAGSAKLIQISLTGTRWRYAIVMVHLLLVTQKLRLGLVHLYNFEILGVYCIGCCWFCVLHIQIRHSCYIWVYFDVSFFNRKQLLYTTERKWVILQRPNHMGNYYEWTLINWHVKSEAGYTFTVIQDIIFSW